MKIGEKTLVLWYHSGKNLSLALLKSLENEATADWTIYGYFSQNIITLILLEFDNHLIYRPLETI